ncbi:cytochrome P450 [Sphingopyxis sp. EG6]|nr:cytochrome P450 [Sphingopyxis sp. EG6]
MCARRWRQRKWHNAERSLVTGCDRNQPSPPRRRGPLEVYAAAENKAGSGPRLRGGDGLLECPLPTPKLPKTRPDAPGERRGPGRAAALSSIGAIVPLEHRFERLAEHMGDAKRDLERR